MSSRQKLALCVSTSHPSSALTAGGGGGSVVLLCPHTGSILSSMRASGDNASRGPLGILTLSLFPRQGFAGSIPVPQLVMASGGSVSKRDDTYGMLLSLREAAAAPLLHWKCRLPEAQLSAGLIVSPCGNYVVGGGSSGACHVWSTIGGTMLKSIKAHYRSVTAMTWGDCGRLLVTAGADGMVHVFSLMDLVDRGMTDTVAPVRTWTIHHLPVTALETLPSGRLASASEDGQLVILEIFSEKTIAKIQMPHAISKLVFQAGRLYAGALQGSIFCLDLDSYAMHKTSRLGVVLKRQPAERTHVEEIFSIDSSESYKAELRGHVKPITCLAVVDENEEVLLVSGDEGGIVRIWDMASRACTQVIRPWSHSANATTTSGTKRKAGAKAATASKVELHPITSIVVVQNGNDGDAAQSSLGSLTSGPAKENKGNKGIINLFSPLQRYADRDGSDGRGWISVPFLRPKRDSSTEQTEISIGGGKRSRISESELAAASTEALSALQGGNEESDAHMEATRSLARVDESQPSELDRLREELASAKSTIERWETVNNQLLAKLQEHKA